MQQSKRPDQLVLSKRFVIAGGGAHGGMPYRQLIGGQTFLGMNGNSIKELPGNTPYSVRRLTVGHTTVCAARGVNRFTGQWQFGINES